MEDNSKDIFSKNLEYYMSKKRINNVELAQILNVSESTVGKWLLKKSFPRMGLVEKMAMYFGINKSQLLEERIDGSQLRSSGIKIPVLGRISAGLPLYATEDIIDYEEISEEQNRTGEFFCLQINGSSMEPRMTTGDVVVVRKQKNVENGEIAVVIVNGNDATVKKVKHTEEGLILIPTNPTFETIYYTSKEVQELPVKIIGKVVELRAKF